MQSSALGWIGNNLALFLLLAGAGLTIAEAFAPGAHFIVLGVALLVAGLVGLVLPSSMGLVAPAVLAAVVLGAGAATFYVYRQFDFYGGKGGEQTSDSDSLRGATGRVTERVTTTGGEVKLDDGGFNPYYRARSADGEIEVGTEVMVMDPGGGNIVKVAPVEGFDEIERELERGRTGGDSTPGNREGRDRSDSEDPEDREFERDTA
jgi:membrane protein implicated in regulation of membrane protease activity